MIPQVIKDAVRHGKKPEPPAKHFSWHSGDFDMPQCKVCGDDTNLVVNIAFKATPVCDGRCLTITKQIVAWWQPETASKRVSEMEAAREAERASLDPKEYDGW